MVERNLFLRVLSHLVMVLGLLIVAFPLYLAFVASTHTAQDILQVPMPLLPGATWWKPTRRRCSAAAPAPAPPLRRAA